MKIKSILIVACIGSMFTACSSKDDYKVDSEKQLVRINASIKGMQTRSTDASKIQNTSFVDGAEINVRIETPGGTPALGIPESGYAIYKKNGLVWESDNDVYTFGDGIYMDVLAIYPSKDALGTLITTSSTTFDVQEEQDTDDNYRMSDLMIGSTSVNTPSVNIELAHCLSKITVILNSNTDFSLEALKSKVGPVEISAKRRANFSFNGWTLNLGEASSTGNSCVSFNGSNEALCSTGISCVIPPQQIQGNAKLFDICYDVDNWYCYYAPAEGFNFEKEKEYIFYLTLEKTGVTLSEPTIKGWTPVTQESNGVAK